MQPSSNDLVLRGGRVIDPAQGIDGIFDVSIRDNRIAAIGENLAGPARETIDVRGKLVLGGWVTDGQRTGEPAGVVRAYDAVSGAFADTAADVLDAVRRTESSLRRLKNKGAGAEAAAAAGTAAPASAASSSEMTDADKIAAQILLDVAAFGKAGKELGCGDLGALAEFRRLWEVAAGGAAAAGSEEGKGSGGEQDFDVERVLAEAAARQQQQQQAVAPSPPPPPPPPAAPAAPSMGPP